MPLRRTPMAAIVLGLLAGSASPQGGQDKAVPPSPPRGRLIGFVLDAAGRPVADASVFGHARRGASDSDALRRRDEENERFGVRTDATGCYAIDLAPSEGFRIGAYEASAGIGEASGGPLADGAVLPVPPIVLEERLVIEGRITCPDAMPAAGAILRVHLRGPDGQASDDDDPWRVDGPVSGMPSAATFSDSAGRFRFAGLARGDYEIQNLESDWQCEVAVPAGTKDALLVADWPRLRVTVVWPRQPTRLPYGVIEVADHEFWPIERGDGINNVWFRRDPGDLTWVWVWAELELAKRVLPSQRWEEHVMFVIPELSLSRRVRVRAATPDGEPLEDFSADLLAPDTRYSMCRPARGPDGWTAEPLPAGRCILEVSQAWPSGRWDPIWLRTRREIDVPDAGDLDVLVRIERGGCFEICAREASGASVGAELFASFRKCDGDGRWQDFRIPGYRCSRVRGPDPIGFGGRARHRSPLEPGDYEARLEAEGFKPAIVPFEIHAGEVTEVHADMTPPR